MAVRVLDRPKRATTRSGRSRVALALTLYQTPRQGGLFRTTTARNWWKFGNE